jgi:hypothetical protein
LAALNADSLLDVKAVEEVALDPAPAVATTAALNTTALADAGVTRSLLLSRPLSKTEVERVEDALSGGASVVEAAILIARERGVELELRTLTDEVVDQPEPDAELAQRDSPDLAALPLATNVLERELELRKRIANEFGSFPDHVREAFDKEKALNEADSALASYRYIRTRLWAKGRKNAAELFGEIRSPDGGAKLLGVEIENGAHRILVEKLQTLREAEPGKDPAITAVIGFQPRRIAGSDKLSNHVFGLAIDINAKWNPDIKSREAIEVVLRHTGIDFGKPLLARGAAVEDVYQVLQQASNAMRDWLRLALPQEARLRGAFDEATNSVKTAERALRNAHSESERRAATAALDQAQADLRKARDEFNASLEAFEVGVLAKEWGRKTLDAWETTGLFTIPIDLARQLMGLGFGWGAEYEKHKDVMHFELDPEQVLPHQQ